ncbi:Predicted amidohydrolase [Candidatus Pantoea symbiotica]|jgi:predicted amidohydrolase|uniref:Predicted amidohydrolase n=1 Tax=Candidatus Pantoea symbiotica TaxID=1884370 RepID=A0A1I4D046_9GAMM|nr:MULTISPECIES: carbon-nitrogen hydrolase family protein [Pantoea]KAJ9429903.1 carbon-nitrogen hydrolase family protein [Pantoea sp. YR343]MRT25506.1 carbon-nitrogen hydrolase family protein [Enterobacteriaceae bacterium RIT697]SFK86974.1 Predicted amidohydrolase [Pantoea symbiotica]SFV04152.1 Predicted amidohydrolase [Pantoea sp. YR525]
MSAITIASVTLAAFYDKARNLNNLLAWMEHAAQEGADLVVFPEQILQGYLPDTLNWNGEAVAWQMAQAEVVPQGESVLALQRQATQLGVHVVFGMTERHPERAEVLFNSAVLLGPQGLVGVYRKVHQPGDEKHVYYPGSDFPVFNTPLGRIGMLICYDKVFPESTRELALKGADVMIMPTAWGYGGDGSAGDADPMVDSYTLFGRVRALENQCWMIESNLCGTHGNLHYHGHSRIIDPLGNIIADSGSTEGMALANVEIQSAILRARSSDYLGYHFLKDYVPVQAPPSPLTVHNRHARPLGESHE